MTESIEFGALSVTYDDRVLRPRPWTFAQSEWATELLGELPAGPVLELCTGAGHIGLAAIAPTDRALIAVDISPVAIEFASANAAAAGLADQVRFRLGDMIEVVQPDERFALVIADPPWVRSDHVTRHPEDPLLAIDGGSDGLALARRCLDVASDHLVPGGVVLLQLGDTGQAEALGAEYAERGLQVSEIREFPGNGVVALLGGGTVRKES